MGTPCPDRGYVEDPQFTEAAAKIGTQKVDDALGAVMRSLFRVPEGWDCVPGSNIRLAKTLGATWGGYDIPALRVWFVINPDTTLTLLYLEPMVDGEAEDADAAGQSQARQLRAV